MDRAITYTNHLGESVSFSQGSPYGYTGTDLHGGSWSLTDMNGRVSSTGRDSKDYSLQAEVRCLGEADGLAMRDRLLDVFEEDTAAGEDGMLEINGWRLKCRLKSYDEGLWWFDDCRMRGTLTLHSARAVWTKDETISIGIPSTATGSSPKCKKYPHTHPYAYRKEIKVAEVVNPGPGAAAATIRIFGPCTSPYVIVGGNRYECSVSAASGERIEIDGAGKTAVLIGSTGARTNIFPKLTNGLRGSGTYAFEPVKVGTNTVSWPATFQFDVVLHHERSAPAWS